jgi:iron complex outermembrane recepter protein
MNVATRAMTLRLSAVAAAVTTVLASASALADAPQLTGQLEEVVVTATKRAIALSDTPAAITAVTSEALGAGGISNINDLSSAVPNLSIGNQFGVNRAFIRGVGLTSIDLGADGAVAFLQNEAQIARPAEQLSGFFDLDRVEVLRGPQGTTYGRGATAGVVNLVTKKPTDQLEGYADVTLGNYASKIFEGAVGGPLSDRVSARVAGKYEKHDGFGTNLYTGKPVDDRDAYALRASVRVKASDTVVVDLIADHFSEDDNNYAFHYFGGTNFPITLANVYGGTTIFDHGGNVRNIWSREDAVNKRHGSSATAIVDWKPAGFEFKSVTAWRDFVRFNRDDLAATDAHLYGQNNYDESSTSWSQEFTLSTKAGGIDWLAGAMYFHEKNPGSVLVPLYNLGPFILGGNCTPITAGAALPCSAFDATNYHQSGTVTTDAYGIYAQGTYEILPRLNMTLGARFNDEKRSGVGTFEFGALGLLIPTDKSKSWNAVTPKFLLEYRTADNSLVYGSVTRGFKSGVINIGSTNDVINPEYVTSFEVGYKTKALDGKAFFGLSAFYYDYKDLQVGFVNQASTVETKNAAKARNYGLEFESQAKLSEGFNADFALTYLNAKYKSFVNNYYRAGNSYNRPPVAGSCPDPTKTFCSFDLSGNNLSNAPEFSGHLGLTYKISMGQSGQVALHGEAVYSDKVYFTEWNNSDAEQPAYTLMNFSAGYTSADDRWSVTAWVRNAGDKLVTANNIITAPLYLSSRVGTLMPPRTFGVTAGVKF